MSYTRTKAAVFGAAYSGLATVAYSLDGTTWTTTGVTELATGSGIYSASITFTDSFRGVLRWRTASTAGKYAAEEINPETAEPAASVWAASTRTLSAFGFTVSASLSGSPVFRNQDAVTAPTYDDCLASAWAAANADEDEDDAAKTWVRKMPNKVDPMRSFVLTTDANGTPVGRS